MANSITIALHCIAQSQKSRGLLLEVQQREPLDSWSKKFQVQTMFRSLTPGPNHVQVILFFRAHLCPGARPCPCRPSAVTLRNLWPYILKAKVRTLPIIFIFHKIIVWERENYQLCSDEFCHKEQKRKRCVKVFWRNAIYAIFLQSFDVEIDALFPQFFVSEKQTS